MATIQDEAQRAQRLGSPQQVQQDSFIARIHWQMKEKPLTYSNCNGTRGISMPEDQTQRYMPHYAQDSIRGRAKHLFSELTYNIWRRELTRLGKVQPDRPLKIVDIGCGPGFLLSCFEKWFPAAELTGIDQSEELLKAAKERCKKLTALIGVASSLPLPDGYADAAFALHVAEHLPQPDQFFMEAHRILRPGGLFAIATPNPEGIGSRLMGKRWQGYDDPTHISLHGPSYWEEQLDKAGFEVVRQGTTGLSGIPLFNKLPLGLIHWIPGYFFGYFPWKLGEACVYTAVRRAS